jgi:hypothetical protein
MNKERLLILADILGQNSHVQSLGIGFDITKYFGTGGCNHECGTVACIAGHAYIMHLQEKGLCNEEIRRAMRRDEGYIPERAQKYLGLTDEQSFGLFLGYISRDYLEGITPKKAATVIRRFVKTGKVEWRYRRLDSAILDVKRRRQAAGLTLAA